MKDEFEVVSKTEHKEGVAVQLQNQAGGKVLGQITLNFTAKEGQSFKKSPGDRVTVSVAI